MLYARLDKEKLKKRVRYRSWWCSWWWISWCWWG